MGIPDRVKLKNQTDKLKNNINERKSIQKKILFSSSCMIFVRQNDLIEFDWKYLFHRTEDLYKYINFSKKILKNAYKSGKIKIGFTLPKIFMSKKKV